MNNIILRGRLTANAEVKVNADEKDTTVAHFTLAVPDRGRKNGSADTDVDFIKVVAFNAFAESIKQYTCKGSEILLTGRLHTYSYIKNNKKVYMTEVIAEYIEFISKCIISNDDDNKSSAK